MYNTKARQLRRTKQGLTNLNPDSTKISRSTESGKEGQPGYRKGRFKPQVKPLFDYQVKDNLIKAKQSVK